MRSGTHLTELTPDLVRVVCIELISESTDGRCAIQI